MVIVASAMDRGRVRLATTSPQHGGKTEKRLCFSRAFRGLPRFHNPQ